MTQINSFVKDAREKGLTDETICSALKAQGWDVAMIDVALLNLEVPAAPTTQQSERTTSQSRSLSPLMAALQHVLLWFFTASSTITIASVVASLSGVDISAKVLASMIAVTLITFTPYAALFLIFTLKQRRAPDHLIPSKVWSIITICLHSIAAMVAGITLVVTLINSGDFSIWLSALLILLLDLIVVSTYVFAAFGIKLRRTRKIIVIAHLPVLLALFGTLFILSLLQLGPARHDEQLRKDLAASATAVRDYTTAHKTLPNGNEGLVKSDEIRYKKINDTSYSLCATFQANARRTSSYYYADSSFSDAYPYESQFVAYGSGEHCFTITSSPLERYDSSRYY